MKTRTPIPRRRRKPRRVRGREKLCGKAKEARRREIFERSGGRCEAEKRFHLPLSNEVVKWRCTKPITWESFHWSHRQHGAYKCDCMECGEALCADCHLVGVHNPKPCPPKEPMISLHRITCDCQTCKERKDASTA